MQSVVAKGRSSRTRVAAPRTTRQRRCGRTTPAATTRSASSGTGRSLSTRRQGTRTSRVTTSQLTVGLPAVPHGHRAGAGQQMSVRTTARGAVAEVDRPRDAGDADDDGPVTTSTPGASGFTVTRTVPGGRALDLCRSSGPSAPGSSSPCRPRRRSSPGGSASPAPRAGCRVDVLDLVRRRRRPSIGAPSQPLHGDRRVRGR